MASATKTRRRRRPRTRSRQRRSSRLGAHELVFSALPELVRSFDERRLLIFANALAFQFLTALVPFLLFGLGVLGFFDLKQVWTDDIASHIRPHVSPAGFTVISDTVTKVLTQKQLFWVTAGFALAIWQVSGGIRVIAGGLDVIYDAIDERSWLERVRVSLVLAVAVSALVLAAAAVVWLGPLLLGHPGQPLAALAFLLRWGIAAVLLGLATGLTIRFAPDSSQPAEWVSFGTLITVGAWIAASLLFGLYVRFVASYGSAFGALATLVVAIAYIYISTTVFFVGAQADAIVRRRVEGNAQGR